MSPETLLVAGYAGFLLLAALVIEWLSAHTHRRSLRYRTAGFTYHEQHDHWECPEGEHLWPHEFDHERRLVRYRAKAHVCNACPSKDACTDSDRGREIVRPLDPWPHSEAGRFHRGISLMLVALALLVLVVGRRAQPPAGRGGAAARRAVRRRGRRPPPVARPAGASLGLPGVRAVARAAPQPGRRPAVTLIRFLHIVALAFFVGGQLVLVVAIVPAVRRAGDDELMLAVARRFGIGSLVAILVLVATGAAMASHFDRWHDSVLQVKLMLVVLVGVLIVFHITSPRSRALSLLVFLVSLAVVWLGVELAH